MSDYYKPDRKKEWNYGGPRWKLSRSKIALFQDCPRCFYMDNKLGTARPPGFPFNINSAVDALLKKEFDVHRKAGTPHPIHKALKLVPFAHDEMDAWRENFKGIQHIDEGTGFLVTGAVDDVWTSKDGVLHIVDYKSTSKDAHIIALEEDWHIGYKRQMEIYQWLLRQKGFKVSDTGYFVYANAQKDRPDFSAKLDFEMTLIPYKGKADWVPSTLKAIKACLDSDVYPGPGAACDFCNYYAMRTTKTPKAKKAV